MPERKRRPNLDERFTVPETIEYEDAVKRLLGVVETDDQDEASPESD
jgi:hypothetical protein